MKRKIAFVTILTILVLSLVPLIALAAPDDWSIWSDNFETYATGTDLHGLNGWKGWFNDPAATAYTSNAQAYSGINSVEITGNTDLVQEYSTNSGLVNYRFWQYIPSGLVGQSYYIMLNQYDDTGATNNWSTQVLFDGATDMIVDTGASGATMAYVADQWIEGCIEIDLTNDTQAFYYNGTLFYTGTWSGHVSGGGITAIGAVDLYANGASPVYYDDISLNMGPCSNPGPMVSVDVSKSLNNVPPISTNGIATFTIGITNTGNITLTTVTAVDVEAPNCDMTVNDLAPGGSTSYVCTDTGFTDSYTNTVVVSGTNSFRLARLSDDAYVAYASPTGVSLSSFGSDPMGNGQVWVLALLGGALATGVYLVFRRRRQLS